MSHIVIAYCLLLICCFYMHYDALWEIHKIRLLSLAVASGRLLCLSCSGEGALSLCLGYRPMLTAVPCQGEVE